MAHDDSHGSSNSSPCSPARRLATLAALLADETRASFCLALLDGRAWTAGELARHAGVATGAAREETLRLGRDLARLPVPVTVDIEGGFGAQPAEAAELAADLVRAGAAGVNIEDGRPDGTLAPLAFQRELIGAVKEAAPRLFVNARTDTYWLPGCADETGGPGSATEGSPGLRRTCR